MRKKFPGKGGVTRVKMADELKVVLSRYSYRGSIASLAGTGNKRIQAFIKLIVEELKSCDTLTGEAKEK